MVNKVTMPIMAEDMCKLNSVMDRFGDLEQRLEQQEQSSTTGLSVLSQILAHSSSHVAEAITHKQLPSMKLLKNDSEIQVSQALRGIQQGRHSRYIK